MANFFLTPRMIISGSDSLSAAASELQKLGQKAFIVTDETMVKLGNVAFLEDVLKKNGTSYFIFPKVNYEPDDLIVKEGAAVYQENHCDHLIALGGGSPIDTAKAIAILLNDDAPLSSYMGKIIDIKRPPLVAVPTTAGTGAETTRFAVYYDHGKKMSADNVRYLPTDQLLIPEFTATQTPYQRASTEFDAYAQAVESLWAVGATDESRTYAQKALDLMAAGEQMLGSYWAGRAIDISRTTAAHALSYYMTATYGIPHGHAVYMMFPYVCKANGREEFIKEIPVLQTLRDFAAERNLDWNQLVDTLLANVNPARLANNPCPITRDVFG